MNKAAPFTYVLPANLTTARANLFAFCQSSWFILSRDESFRVVRIITGPFFSLISAEVGIELLSANQASEEDALLDAALSIWNSRPSSVDGTLDRTIAYLLNPERLRNAEEIAAAADASRIVYAALASRLQERTAPPAQKASAA